VILCLIIKRALTVVVALSARLLALCGMMQAATWLVGISR
jgi:hypothetical protein